MLKRFISLTVVVAIVTMLALPASAQSPTAQLGGLTVPVSGTVNGSGATGTFTILRFVNNAGQLGAFGTLSLTTANGTLVSQVVLPVTATTAPAATTSNAPAAQATCTVLELTLGPLDLNLAGLQVHLDTVHLLITANPALGLLGQLLSSLLCGSTLSGLLANLQQNLQQVINILNQILALL